MNWICTKMERILPKSPRTIAWLYIVSISVVLIELLVALAFFSIEEKIVEKDAHFINVAGRQSMLSQRILLSSEYLLNKDDVAMRQSLRADIHEFEQNLEEIVNSPDTPASVKELLFGAETVKAAVPVLRRFSLKAKQIVGAPIDANELNDLKNLVRTDLLPMTQGIADAFQSDAERNLQNLRETWTNSILLAAIILGSEVLFVFLPSQKMLSRAFAAVHKKNAELSDKNNQIEIEHKKLVEAIADANALRQEQAEFTYALSHDMKAPANTVRMIQGELQELLANHPDEEVAMFLDLLRSTTERMGLLVEDVLDYTTTLGEVRNVDEVDLNDLFKGVVEDLSGDLKAANGRVDVQRLPCVKGSKSQLRMLFQNLVSNGIKFRPKERCSEIQVSCVQSADQSVSIKVADNGIGIAAENQEKIFGLFSRLHLREEYAGTGLGLALCRRIVANHSGRIELSSALGEGSEFTVHLPTEIAS